MKRLNAMADCHFLDSNGDGGRIQFHYHGLPTDPNPARVRVGGNPLGVGMVFGDYVPHGEIWLIKTVTIASNDSKKAEMGIEVQVKVIAENWAEYWGMCLEQFPADESTPRGAMTRDYFILEEGERLASRSGQWLSDLYLLYSGWRLSSACLPQLLGIV